MADGQGRGGNLVADKILVVSILHPSLSSIFCDLDEPYQYWERDLGLTMCYLSHKFERNPA